MRARGVEWALTGLLLAGSVAASAGCRAPGADAPAPRISFLERRSRHATALNTDAPSPNEFQSVAPPEGVEAVRYRSGDLELMAWWAIPDAEPPFPALVYFHGDFSFRASDFENVRPFLDAGFAVMTPTLRGENGNPGRFELLYGEVDDGAAAVRWAARQPEVDGDRIFAFGHSAGGAVAVMLTLFPDLPLRDTGSSGGIYVPETFERWSRMKNNRHLIRFDPEDADETELRVLGPHVADMSHPHVAYIGTDDPWFLKNAGRVEAAAQREGKPFEVVDVPGDHATSLRPALEAFLERTRAIDGR